MAKLYELKQTTSLQGAKPNAKINRNKMRLRIKRETRRGANENLPFHESQTKWDEAQTSSTNRAGAVLRGTASMNNHQAE